MPPDAPDPDCGKPAPYDIGPCVLLAGHDGWHCASDGTEWVTGNQSGIVDVVADMTDYVDQLRVQLARVTQERDEARTQHAAVLAQRDSWWETVGAQKQALRDEITQLREQRAADLVGATPEVPNAD